MAFMYKLFSRKCTRKQPGYISLRVTVDRVFPGFSFYEREALQQMLIYKGLAA